MFFPYETVGFSEEKWESMTRGDRVAIKTYFLLGRDQAKTTFFLEWETFQPIRKLERDYHLSRLPDVKYSLI